MFLTSGRGLSHEAAGVAVAAYWAMMLVGRAALGPLAERVGSSRAPKWLRSSVLQSVPQSCRYRHLVP